MKLQVKRIAIFETRKKLAEKTKISGYLMIWIWEKKSLLSKTTEWLQINKLSEEEWNMIWLSAFREKEGFFHDNPIN